jgi:uncharacterized protein with GYD domain
MWVEGGDFYEDALYRSQEREQREEQGALDSAMQEQTDRVEITTDTQGGLEWMQADIERETKVQETLSLFERFAQEKNIAGFDIFKNFIWSSSKELQASFIDRTNARNIRKVVETSGRFPVNEFEFWQAMIEWIVLEEQAQVEQVILEHNTAVTQGEAQVTQGEAQVTQGEAQVTQTETEAAQTETEAAQTEIVSDIRSLELKEKAWTILSLSELQSVISLIPNIERYRDIIENNTTFTWEQADFLDSVHTDILSKLKNWNYLERNVLPEAYAQWPEAFQRVSESLIALDPSFETRILAWEMTPSYGELPAEQMVRVSGALGTPVDEVSAEAEQSGNIFSLEIPGGLEVQYDVVTNERSISIDGYSLESQIDDTGDYQTPKLEYMRVEQEHLPKLQKIIAAGRLLEWQNISDKDVPAIKESLRSEQGLGYSYYSELRIEALATAQEIQKRLQEAFQEHDTPLQEARETYRTALIDLRNNYQKALKEKDEKTKEVLRFLQSIGFTMIPQYVTDNIINIVNNNSALRAQLGMQEEVDLSNGKLGYNTNTLSNDGLELLDRQAFIGFMNTILTWDPKIPVEYINENNILYHIETPSQDLQTEEQAGKSAYQNFVQRMTGDITFESRAKQNLGLI